MSEHLKAQLRQYQRASSRSSAALPAVVFAACVVAGLELTLAYPISPAWTVALFLILSGMFFLQRRLWLIILPGALPVLAFAPWTGWITFEELDMLILAVAAGGYARMAWARIQPAVASTRASSIGQARSALPWFLAAMFVMSLMFSMLRGFSDAGGFTFGWFQGYMEPMNSVRPIKSFLEVLLLVPVWLAAERDDPRKAQEMLAWGLTIGLALAGLAVVWERFVFVGLLNFSTDYRATGMFWEMHVGGAALDGFLVLTMPFALRQLLTARVPWQWAISIVAIALGGYACLTSFSRGVYLAIPVAMTALIALRARQGISNAAARATMQPRQPTLFLLVPTAVLLGSFAFAGWSMFDSSGYRGLGALLVTVCLALPLAAVARKFTFSQWLVALTMGIAIVIVNVTIALVVPKGAYLAWTLAVMVFWASLVSWSRRKSSLAGTTAFASFAAALTGTGLVAMHWGGDAALYSAMPVLLVTLGVGIAAGLARKPIWPESGRWQLGTVVGMAAVAATISVFSGGAYMGSRFSTGDQDLNVRFAHWRLGLGMLQDREAWLLGKGSGRFPANYFIAGDPEAHPGDYRLEHEGGNAYINLTSGLHVLGWGEMFRVSQRISAPGVGVSMSLRVRARDDVGLHFEICQKHLLYNADCTTQEIIVKGKGETWQTVQSALPSVPLGQGHWYAPQFLVFSIAVDSRGGTIDADDLSLTRADGTQLLVNGDFRNDTAHWFFSSDRYHLPWHMKNAALHVLFEQGVIGLAIWLILIAGALWRTTLGAARRHTLAPALASSIVGFLVVGLFDSLLDVPRISWLFYFLLLVAWTAASPKR